MKCFGGGREGPWRRGKFCNTFTFLKKMLVAIFFENLIASMLCEIFFAVPLKICPNFACKKSVYIFSVKITYGLSDKLPQKSVNLWSRLELNRTYLQLQLWPC